MKRLFLAIFGSLLLSANVVAMDIQAAIDACPSGGCRIDIPCGSHPNGTNPLFLKEGVRLQGESRYCTFIPPIRNGVVVNGVVQRIDAVSVRDVTIDGRMAPGYYGIYWHKISRGDVSQVNIWYAPHGLVVRGPGAYYNGFEDIVSIATDPTNGTALEFYDGANQNSVRGGVFDGRIGLNVVGSNGIHVEGSSLESGSSTFTFCALSGDDNTTSFDGVRTEKPGYGPVFLHKRGGVSTFDNGSC